MNPKQLKSPFRWEERKPHYEDRVLYVPKYYFGHQDWQALPWSDSQMFGNENPLHVEFCSGNGLWIFEKAQAFPSVNWIAVEKRFDRVRKIWSKIKNHSIKNLIVVCGQAESFIDHYVEESQFDEVYINFPDPWPKAKHAKNRIFKQPFLCRLSKVCKSNAKATFVTDDQRYSLEIIEQMQMTKTWSSLLSSPYYTEEWDGYGSSYFDELFRSFGQKIRYMQYTNTK